MEKNVLVNVTENNIDGCGSNASLLLSLLVPNDQKTEELIVSLQTKLNEIKKAAIENDVCLDTDERAFEGIKAF